MRNRYRLLGLSAAAVLLPALFVTSSVSGAPHNGPGPHCVTHIGHTYVNLSNRRVYTEGSGGCNSNEPTGYIHDIRHDLEQLRWYGWTGVQTNSRAGFSGAFSVWLPLDRGNVCPGSYRGHVDHVRYGQDTGYGRNHRYTNTAGC